MLIPLQVFSISRIASKTSEGRSEALRGVFVKRLDAGDCIAAATDGKRIVEVRWSDDDTRLQYPNIEGVDAQANPGFSAIIPKSDWEAAAKRITTRISRPILQHCLLEECNTGGIVRLAIADLTDDPPVFDVSVVAGSFLDYKSCIPQYTVGQDAVEIGLSPALLERLLAVIRIAATNECNRGVRLTIANKPNQPVLFSSWDNDKDIRATAVQMPIYTAERPCSFIQTSSS